MIWFMVPLNSSGKVYTAGIIVLVVLVVPISYSGYKKKKKRIDIKRVFVFPTKKTYLPLLSQVTAHNGSFPFAFLLRAYV